jgi:hypothetical protein
MRTIFWASVCGGLISLLSFLYLLRYKKKFVVCVDETSWFVLIPLSPFVPFIAAFYAVKRWYEWSMS